MSEPGPAPPPAPSPGERADAPPPTPGPGSRWGGYLVVLGLLVGLGWLASRPASRPRLVPRWLWWFLTGMDGQAFYAAAVLLTAGAATDLVDTQVAAGRRTLGRLLLLVALVGLAALAVVSLRAHLYLVAAAAALMGVVGSLPRRAFPGLPRARIARRRRD